MPDWRDPKKGDFDLPSYKDDLDNLSEHSSYGFLLQYYNRFKDNIVSILLVAVLLLIVINTMVLNKLAYQANLLEFNAKNIERICRAARVKDCKRVVPPPPKKVTE